MRTHAVTERSCNAVFSSTGIPVDEYADSAPFDGMLHGSPALEMAMPRRRTESVARLIRLIAPPTRQLDSVERYSGHNQPQTDWNER
jgi:hypothetical protein